MTDMTWLGIILILFISANSLAIWQFLGNMHIVHKSSTVGSIQRKVIKREKELDKLQ